MRKNSSSTPGRWPSASIQISWRIDSVRLLGSPRAPGSISSCSGWGSASLSTLPFTVRGKAFSTRIGLNKCRDWVRRRRVRQLLGIARPLDAGVYQVADPAPDPWRAADDRRRLEATAAAIAKLPRALKEPLLLRTIEGLSQTDAASVLGISGKAVETRLRRARLKLKEALLSPVA
ncbi:RNA polymerase sigma factor [Sphingomonas koreensis]|nr:RNA polymerase sigma factor [Sphingomonas koreensis]